MMVRPMPASEGDQTLLVRHVGLGHEAVVDESDL